MIDLFSELEQESPREFEKHLLQDGEVWVMHNFMTPKDSANYFKVLLSSINWRQEQIKMYGKTYDVPRKTAWYGYEGFNYIYSNIE